MEGRCRTPEKIAKVAALKERIQDSEALLLAEYRGLSVHDATELRRALSEQARFAIVKNTLMVRAAADAGVAELEALLEGPTAVAFVRVTWSPRPRRSWRPRRSSRPWC